jgi:hypothetical protein
MYATEIAPATPRTIQRIRLADQVARWERIAGTYRERGQTTLARRAERTLAAARRAAADESAIALVSGAEPAPEFDEATEADRGVYEYFTSAAWEA